MGEKNKKISPNKKFYVESNGALLNVASRENDSERYTIALSNYELRKPDIFCWSADSQAIGMFIVRGIPFDASGYESVKTNYWLGIWYPFENQFFTVHFPEQVDLEINYEPIDSIEVLAAEKTIICSIKGKEFKRVQMPKEPMLSIWEKEKQNLESLESKSIDPNKKEWTWNHNSEGYEGVSLYSDEVLWFSHTHNPHSGGAAQEQSFADFLANGACCFIPNEFRKELYEAVKRIAGDKKK
ncbi:MAG TPA: hypothetical protein PKY82_25210 [Pyrinomonadaceae bacterium]|nr:hypothetical protein [Pyrinomonadaceae bacterium]